MKDFIETWNELNNINFISTQTNRAPWLRICIGSIFQTFPIKKFLINPEGRLTVLRNSSKSSELSSKHFWNIIQWEVFPHSRLKNTMFCVMYYFVRYIRHSIINGCEIVKTRPLLNLVYHHSTLFLIKWQKWSTCVA